MSTISTIRADALIQRVIDIERALCDDLGIRASYLNVLGQTAETFPFWNHYIKSVQIQDISEYGMICTCVLTARFCAGYVRSGASSTVETMLNQVILNYPLLFIHLGGINGSDGRPDFWIDASLSGASGYNELLDAQSRPVLFTEFDINIRYVMIARE